MRTIDFRAIRPYLPGALLRGFAAVLAFVLGPLAGSLRASPTSDRSPRSWPL